MHKQNLIEVSDGWSLWREVCLRGAGFPIDLVLALAAKEAAASAEKILSQEAELARCSEVAISTIEPVIEGLMGKDRRPLANALGKLRANSAPAENMAGLEFARGEIQAVRDAHSSLSQSRTALNEAFEVGAQRTTAKLIDIATSPLFREAIAWQNLDVLHNAIDKLPAKAPIRKQRVAASYLQRYTTKNDTIGFFGPVGWAMISQDVRSACLVPGETLLEKRSVYFEHWAIQALAQKIAEDPRLWPSLIPRRDPTKRVIGKTCHYPIGKSFDLPEEFAAAFAACDAQRTAQQLVNVLEADGIVDSSEDGFDLLSEMAEQRLIYWTLEIPTAGFFPERALRDLLARAQGEAKDIALAALDQLETAKDAVQGATGDADKLCTALEALNETFESLTGEKSSRSGGQAYAGRTLVFEDCRRTAKLTLGHEFVERIAAPMALILASARWFSWEIAQRYKKELSALYVRLTDETGSPTIDFLQFQHAFRDLFPGPEVGGGIVDEVRDLLQLRWSRIFEMEGRQDAIQISSRDIQQAVATAFASPAPGWPSARHQSPDVLLSASGMKALADGDYQIVLGEVHVGMCSPTVPMFVKEHVNPDELIAAREWDIPVPGIAPTWNEAVRANLFSISRHDLDLETGAARSHREREQVIGIGSCYVTEEDGELVVRSHEHPNSFHLLAFIEQHLIAESYSEFQIAKKAKHTPRVTIDRMVVHREQWLVDSKDLSFLAIRDRADLFLAVRKWARASSLPRFCFAKTKSETKPFFFDLDSPLTVENFVRLASQSDTMVISEMLPDFDHAWLEDKDGDRYCAELRLCFKDPEVWRYK